MGLALRLSAFLGIVTLLRLTLRKRDDWINCTARQCSPLRRKFMGCSISNPALSLLMKHLVIGQR